MRVGGDDINDEDKLSCGVHGGSAALTASACLSAEGWPKRNAFADDSSCFCMITVFDECVCACKFIGLSEHLATPTAFIHPAPSFVLFIAFDPPQSFFGWKTGKGGSGRNLRIV